MKNYTGLITLFLFFAFLSGMAYIGVINNEQNSKQEIACIQAGGKIQTMPKACVNKD